MKYNLVYMQNGAERDIVLKVMRGKAQKSVTGPTVVSSPSPVQQARQTAAQRSAAQRSAAQRSAGQRRAAQRREPCGATARDRGGSRQAAPDPLDGARAGPEAQCQVCAHPLYHM